MAARFSFRKWLKKFLLLDGSRAMTGDFDCSAHEIKLYQKLLFYKQDLAIFASSADANLFLFMNRAGSQFKDIVANNITTVVGFRPYSPAYPLYFKGMFADWSIRNVAIIQHGADPCMDVPYIGELAHITGAHHHTLPDTVHASPSTGDIYHVAASKETKVYDGSGSNVLSKIKTGTFTGDGGATKAITGLGFQPKDLEIVMHISGGTYGVYHKNDQMGVNAAAERYGANTFVYGADIIISLDADGFTVGDTASMNADTVVFSYVARG